MSRLTLRRKGAIRAAVISAAGLLGAAVPMSAFGQLAVNLQSQTGAAGSGNSTIYLTPQGYNSTPGTTNVFVSSVPIYVYGTVTGAHAQASSGTNAVPDGLQYLYYNIANATAPAGNAMTVTEVAGSFGTPLLNANFGGGNSLGDGGTDYGSQPGAVGTANTGSAAISVGSASAITAIAKPRNGGPIWDSTTDGTNIYAGGTSASFLVENLQFSPSNTGAFGSANPFVPTATLGATNEVETKFSASIPSTGVYVGANWWQDSTSTSTPTGFQSPMASGGTGVFTGGSVVNVVDTVVGDADGDGKVTANDLGLVLSHFGGIDLNWTHGNFDYYTVSASETSVDAGDLGSVLSHFGTNLGTLFPTDIGADQAALDDPQVASMLAQYGFVAVPEGQAVPEPMSLGLLSVLGGATLLRRRRRSS